MLVPLLLAFPFNFDSAAGQVPVQIRQACSSPSAMAPLLASRHPLGIHWNQASRSKDGARRRRSGSWADQWPLKSVESVEPGGRKRALACACNVWNDNGEASSSQGSKKSKVNIGFRYYGGQLP